MNSISSGVSWAKSSDRLHFFRSNIMLYWILWEGPANSWGWVGSVEEYMGRNGVNFVLNHLEAVIQITGSNNKLTAQISWIQLAWLGLILCTQPTHIRAAYSTLLGGPSKVIPPSHEWVHDATNIVMIYHHIMSQPINMKHCFKNHAKQNA